jgi:hypothetical protein
MPRTTPRGLPPQTPSTSFDEPYAHYGYLRDVEIARASLGHDQRAWTSDLGFLCGSDRQRLNEAGLSESATSRRRPNLGDTVSFLLLERGLKMRDLRKLKPGQSSRKFPGGDALPKQKCPLDRFEGFSRRLKCQLITLGVITGDVYEQRFDAKKRAEERGAA